MTDVDRVIQRLISAETSLHDFKAKVHHLRRLVAGDASANGVSNDADPDYSATRAEWPPILVTEIEEGRNNGLLKAIRTLVLQTTYFAPTVEFQGLNPRLAALNAAYVQSRIKSPPWGCGARDEMRMALLEYAIGGMGWVYTPMRAGKPTIAYADTLDMLWDQSSRLPQNISWAAVSVVRTVSYWVSVFGVRAFQEMIGADNAGIDKLCELTFYYDVEGPKGSYIVLRRAGKGWDNKPVTAGSNPCTFEVDGEVVPFLPFESTFFLTLPSVRLPIGFAEMMLPAQIATWRAERTILDIIERGAGFYEVDSTMISADEIRKFEDGETGAFLMKSKAGDAVTQKPPMIIPPALIDFRRYASSELTEQSGANPFAMGDRVEGVEFAAQVTAIQGSAGLTSGTIAKDHATLWQRVIPKFLAKGKAYDSKPCVLYLDGLELTFDASDPIRDYLRPDAEVIVEEDTMAFKPRAQKVQEAMMMLQVARANMDIAPGGPRIALEETIQALGVKNTEPWFTPPPGAMMPPAAGAMPPGSPPGAAAPSPAEATAQ